MTSRRNGVSASASSPPSSPTPSSDDDVLTRWLPYERDIIEEFYHLHDGLLVMARGLGIQRLLAYFIRMYSSPKTLVLCLNMNEQVALFTQLVLALGLDRKYLPKAIDATTSIQERQRLYRHGGCFFVTSRILVVDFLNKKIDGAKVTGLLVYDAHRITETSIEAFILRLFREVNRNGFIKAFSEEPVQLASGFNKMEQVLKHLYIRQVMLFPRFHVSIHSQLEKSQPDVYEIEISFSPKMKQIQQAILVAMEATMKELQRSTKAMDASDLTMDKALSKSFTNTIRRQLDPVWHQLHPKTKQLVGDLTTLRQLLSYLPRYDAISYYSLLVNHQVMSGQQRFPSAWLFTEAADRILTAAKQRLYQIVDKQTKLPVENVRKLGLSSEAAGLLKTSELQMTLEGNPKWQALVQILDEIFVEQEAEESEELQEKSGSYVVVMVKDDRTCAQLREVLALGEKGMMRKRFGHYLVQREALMRRNGTRTTASMGCEQQLLLAEAAKFRTREVAFQTNASHVIQATSSANDAQKKGKKRQATDQQQSSSTGTMYAAEVASFGMSLEQLEAVAAVDDARARNKRQLLATAPSLGGTARKPTNALGLSIEPVDRCDQVVLCTYEQAKQHHHGASALLHDLQPSCVILYDPDMAFIRELEVFHAMQTSSSKLEIYFMLYDESAEQQAYLSEIHAEKKAFETLIYQKAHLMMPANVYDVPYHVKAQQQQNQRPQYSMDTRTSSRPITQAAGVKVVVDVREFRSALPSMLHKDGLLVQPVTLEIGDYILSPTICVERKSISDLFGSFASGRLFNQAENMGRFYELPVLLIEFTQGKAFSLQDANEIGSEISASNIISKISLLVLHFPKLRILWSRSPHATVDLFKVIKKNQLEPDVEVAALLGTGGGGGGGATEDGEGGGAGSSYYNTGSMDVLRKLPGINDHNFRKVLARVTNLAQLSQLSQDEMTEMLGKVCGKRLFTFFNSTL